MDKLRNLRKRLRTEIEDPYMGEVGIKVWDLRRDEEIFSHGAGAPFMMASTAKIFTAGAALSLLGSDFRVATEIWTSGICTAEGVLQGDLYIKGGGDPSFGNADYIKKFFYGIGTQVRELVSALGASGISRVEGAVVADSTSFDSKVKPTGRLAALTYERAQVEIPELRAAERIAEILSEEGIAVAHSARVGEVPREGARLIGRIEAPMIRELVIPMGRRSDNFIAEMIAKLLAVHVGNSQGATLAGAEIISKFVTDLGTRVQQVDGSGLSFQNKVSPSGVVNFLKHMANRPFAPHFIESLSVMGLKGTLHDRARNTKAQGTVLAKTGTHLTPAVNQAERGFRSSALSGYCMDGPEPRLAFSVMQEKPKSRYTALAGQERIAVALAEYVCS